MCLYTLTHNYDHAVLLINLRYTSLKLCRDSECFSDMLLQCSFAANQKASSENRKASSENQKVSSEDAEGFFQRALALYLFMFLKNGATSLMDLLELRLGLPELHLSAL